MGSHRKRCGNPSFSRERKNPAFSGCTPTVIILALALDTAPITLIYPGPYFDKMIRLGPKSPEFPEIIAAEWFLGLLDPPTDVPLDDEGGT